MREKGEEKNGHSILQRATSARSDPQHRRTHLCHRRPDFDVVLRSQGKRPDHKDGAGVGEKQGDHHRGGRHRDSKLDAAHHQTHTEAETILIAW